MNRKQKFITLEKLFNSGYNNKKAIKDLKIKDTLKLKNITKADMDCIAEIQDVICECKTIDPLLEYLSQDDDKEV